MKPPSPCTGSSTTHATVDGSTSVLNSCSRAAIASPEEPSAVGIRSRRAIDLGRERPEPSLYGLHLARHRHGEQRAAVERALERDDRWAAGRRAGDLDRVLDRFRARVDEHRALLAAAARRELGESPAHADVRLVDPDDEALVQARSACSLHGSTTAGCR